MPNKKNTSSELQGITRLVTDAVIGVTDIVEAMHGRIVHPPMIPSTPIQHLITKIAGITYRNIRWSTRFIGTGIDKVLGGLTSVLGQIESTDEREAIRSVLNGVIGDHLAASDNPLTIDMQLRYAGLPIAIDTQSLTDTYPAITGKILLMVHGSCMNDIQWTRADHNHGEVLADALNITPIYLHYNSGLHVSTNGQSLNELLKELVKQWPVPVEELIIVAHSMGGLVTRSAMHYGQADQSWMKHVRKVIFLGTPHHGAPLEKAGNYIDVILEAIPYAKPFARLGKIRSAGVTDLRYGNLLDEDWADADRFEMKGDHRISVPLPSEVACYSIAAIKGKTTTSKSSRLLGDNLVSVKSALGQHKDPTRDLGFKKEQTLIVSECTHSDLLSNQEVNIQMKEWLR